MIASINLTAAMPEALTLPPFRAVVMDMDGLALDTEAAYCHAWRAAAWALGFPLSQEFCQSLFGCHADDVQHALIERCGDTFDLHRFHALAEESWRQYLEANGVAKMPELDRLLAVLRARRLPYALATNSDAPYALECLQRANALAQFPVIVTRDEVANGKPAPDLFLEGARRLGLPPPECLGLEDSEPGLQACCRAGMIPVLIPSRITPTAMLPRPGVRVFRGLGVLADAIERG